MIINIISKYIWSSAWFYHYQYHIEIYTIKYMIYIIINNIIILYYQKHHHIILSITSSYHVINIIIISYYQYHHHMISKNIWSSTWLYHYQYHCHIMINIILKSIWSSKSLSISYCNIYDRLHACIIINIYDQVINTIWCIKWYLIWLL